MAGVEELGILIAHSAVEQAEAMEFHRSVRNPQDCFELSEKKFIKLFRINKNMADELINYISPFMVDRLRSSALSPEEKILGSLRFFAAGSYQQDVGQNFNISMSQPSVSRSINEVIAAVHSSGFFNEKVHFHTNLNDLNTARQKYYENYQFPGVVGCVDCTHVAIVPPIKENAANPEYIYVNRKSYHSINVQLICDPDLRIINVNAKFPGSTHDSFIWNSSSVLPVMETLNRRYPGNYYLLGDSGYGLRPWMLTPFKDTAEGSPESHYNERHRHTRSIIERVNGILKMRFRCLLKHRVLHYIPETASKIINTCCALHNMCIDNNLETILPEENDDPLDGMNMYDEGDTGLSDDQLDNQTVNPSLLAGRRLRQSIVSKYFQ